MSPRAQTVSRVGVQNYCTTIQHGEPGNKSPAHGRFGEVGSKTEVTLGSLWPRICLSEMAASGQFKV